MTDLNSLDTVACTLLADGTSDRVLLPVLRWLLDQHCQAATELQFVEQLPSEPETLAERIDAALEYYPCHVLFIHRDAEGEQMSTRQVEIETAWDRIHPQAQLVTVIPVRMTEAWLLLDERAIRAAAGNPSSVVALDLPKPNRLEQHKDPKSALFDALRAASELSASRLRTFRPEARRHRVTELMTDESFRALRQLPSFESLETQVRRIFQT